MTEEAVQEPPRINLHLLRHGEEVVQLEPSLRDLPTVIQRARDGGEGSVLNRDFGRVFALVLVDDAVDYGLGHGVGGDGGWETAPYILWCVMLTLCGLTIVCNESVCVLLASGRTGFV